MFVEDDAKDDSEDLAKGYDEGYYMLLKLFDHPVHKNLPKETQN